MAMTNLGLTKLAEECSELAVVACKKINYMHTDEHPNGTNLRQRMLEEIADVSASIEFVQYKFNVTTEERAFIDTRKELKLNLYDEWDTEQHETTITIKGPSHPDFVKAVKAINKAIEDSLEIDDDDPLWLVANQIDGLLQGEGASEDHVNVVKFLKDTGLPQGLVERIHKAIIFGDSKIQVKFNE